MASTATAAELDHLPTHTLGCMEIWGSNRPAHDAVAVPGVQAYVWSRPFQGGLAGGDVYYVSSCKCAMISRFVLADVSGHGCGVDDVAQALRELMRKNINRPDQRRFARSLNEQFASIAKNGRFATAVLATYFPPTRHLMLCNAGHPRPLWYRAAKKCWQHLDNDSPDLDDRVANLPMGIIEPTEYTQLAVKLEPDDLVLAFSDALIEASNPEGRELGEAGLADLVAQLDPTEPVQFGPSLLKAISRWRGGEQAADDQTVLLMHHHGVGKKQATLGGKFKALAKMVGLVDY